MHQEPDEWSKGIAKNLVKISAPEELPFFDEIVAASGKRVKGRDTFMGFGGDAATVLLSGVLLEVGRQVVAFVWANGRDATGELIKNCSASLQEALSKRFKDWIENRSEEKAPITIQKDKASQLLTEIRGKIPNNKLDDRTFSQVDGWLIDKFVRGAD